jgi:hypothetical protein
MDDDHKFIKGFNHGYLLQAHEPQLLAQILKTDNKGDYVEGLRDGKKQHVKDKTLEQIRDIQQSNDLDLGKTL